MSQDRRIIFTGVATIRIHSWYWSVALDYVNVFTRKNHAAYMIRKEDGARWRMAGADTELHLDRYLWKTFTEFCTVADVEVTAEHRNKYSQVWTEMVAKHQQEQQKLRKEQEEQEEQYKKSLLTMTEEEVWGSDASDDDFWSVVPTGLGKEKEEHEERDKSSLLNMTEEELWGTDEFWAGDLTGLDILN